MKRVTFKIIWSDIDESFDDDDCFAVEGWDYAPGQYVEDFAEWIDGNSGYDGEYPNGGEFQIMNVDTGEVFTYKVHTEWSPSFYAYEED